MNKYETLTMFTHNFFQNSIVFRILNTMFTSFEKTFCLFILSICLSILSILVAYKVSVKSISKVSIKSISTLIPLSSLSTANANDSANAFQWHKPFCKRFKCLPDDTDGMVTWWLFFSLASMSEYSKTLPGLLRDLFYLRIVCIYSHSK